MTLERGQVHIQMFPVKSDDESSWEVQLYLHCYCFTRMREDIVVAGDMFDFNGLPTEKYKHLFIIDETKDWYSGRRVIPKLDYAFYEEQRKEDLRWSTHPLISGLLPYDHKAKESDSMILFYLFYADLNYWYGKLAGSGMMEEN